MTGAFQQESRQAVWRAAHAHTHKQTEDYKVFPQRPEEFATSRIPRATPPIHYSPLQCTSSVVLVISSRQVKLGQCKVKLRE